MTEKYERESAKRTLIAELLESTHTFEQDETNYLLLASGDRANRVLIGGTAVTVEEGNSKKPMYKMEVSDPTGSITVTAFKEYSPDAYNMMQQMHKDKDDVPPAFVTVVGKPSTYEPEDDDGIYVSLRGEQINITTQQQRDIFLAEAMEQTNQRFHNEDMKQRSSEVYESNDEWLSEDNIDSIINAVNE